MKTAIQQASDDLLKQLKDLPIETIRKVVHIMHYHLEVEKKQIIKAHDDGIENPDSYGGGTYYNDTFN